MDDIGLASNQTIGDQVIASQIRDREDDSPEHDRQRRRVHGELSDHHCS